MGGRRGTRRLRHTTPPEPLGLHPQQQTPLPLIQVRAQRRVPRRRRVRDSRHTGHYHNRSQRGSENLDYFVARPK